MMVKDLFKNYIYPTSVFAGGMIGVGFLSLPYIALKSGVGVMLIYFLIITSIVILINRMFSEISLKTPDQKRFPGFVGYYLGIFPQTFAVLSAIFGGIAVLSVYLLVGSTFLTKFMLPISGGTILNYSLIYFFVASLIIYFDIKVLFRVEFWVISLLFISLIFILVEGFSEMKLSHIFFYNDSDFYKYIFLPYGPILFSLWGIGLIPETEELISGNKKNLKKIITIATISVAVFYILFTFLILSITGTNTSEMALTNLSMFLGGWASRLVLLVGVASTFIAFISQGIILKKILMYDLKIKKNQAFIMTCFAPMIIFLLGFSNFISLISFVGGILLGIDGILISMMYRKSVGKNIFVYLLPIVFVLGIIYQIIYFVK